MPGKMHDRIDIAKERPPVDRTREIGQRCRLDICAGWNGRNIACRRANLDPCVGECAREGATDETTGAGDKDTHYPRLREKRISSKPTRSVPAARHAISEAGVFSRTQISASAASTMFTANTCAVTSVTLKPLSVAR